MTTYSKPFTKEEIAEMYTRIYECMPESLKDGFIKRLVKFDDVKLLKNFNKRMNIRIRLFAPSMYQIVYN